MGRAGMTMQLVPGARGQLDQDKAALILHLIGIELADATKANGTFHNAHEGWAVLYEEVDELWEEVREKYPDEGKQLKEAVQSAAMAVRFIHDLVGDAALMERASEVIHG
jgi:phosphoglycolate phosphatase-like HAD superfamily hydrolase